MPLDPVFLMLARPRLVLVSLVVILALLAALMLVDLADAVVLATTSPGDEPLLAPFRWRQIPANLA